MVETETSKPAASYSSRQAVMDEAYREAWHRWWYSMSWGERRMLKAQGLERPWVEKRRDGTYQDVREENDLQERLEELAVTDHTPLEELKEKERQIDEAKVRALARARLRNRHFHFFAMFIGTGVRQFDLLKLRVLIVLRQAGPHWLKRYGLVNGSVAKEISRLERATFTLVEAQDYVSLTEILNEAADDDEMWEASDQGIEVRALRIQQFGDFCDEIGKLSRTLDQFARNTLAWLRRTKPKEIAGLGQSQTAVSRKLGEKRATTSAREIQKFEAPQKQAGVRGYHGLGGTKTDAHRRRCAEAQRGNTNRRRGEMRKRGI